VTNPAEFNEVFSSKIRLGIMTLLVTLENVDFSTIKSQLNATDGNLGAHMRVLEGKGYIQVEKNFLNRRPKTSYTLTDEGRKAFSQHLDHLEKVIKTVRRGTN